MSVESDRQPACGQPSQLLLANPYQRFGVRARDTTPRRFRALGRGLRAGHPRLFATLAIASPKIVSEAADWAAMASFVQWASGIASVGLNAVLVQKPR